jgi:hypothetical protein
MAQEHTQSPEEQAKLRADESAWNWGVYFNKKDDGLFVAKKARRQSDSVWSRKGLRQCVVETPQDATLPTPGDRVLFQAGMRQVHMSALRIIAHSLKPTLTAHAVISTAWLGVDDQHGPPLRSASHARADRWQRNARGRARYRAERPLPGPRRRVVGPRLAVAAGCKAVQHPTAVKHPL